MTAAATIFYVLPHLDVPPFEDHRQARIGRERRMVQLSRAAGHTAELYLLSRQSALRRLDDPVGSWLVPTDTPQGTDRFAHVSTSLLDAVQRARPDVVVIKGLGYRLTHWLVLHSDHRFRLVLMAAGQVRDVLRDQADYILAETSAQIANSFRTAARLGRAGVLPKLVEPLVAPAALPRRFDVVNVGRFTANKNQAALLPLADAFRLALVGDGDGWRAVRDLAQQQAQPVHLPGHLDPAATQALIADARLMVHVAHHEGVARVVMEAFALGVPVVASSVAMPGAFEHGVQGLLVPPAQILPSARALLADEPRRAAMGRAALQYAQTHCSEAALGAALQTMLQRVLAGPPRHRSRWIDQRGLQARLALAAGRRGLRSVLRAGVQAAGLGGVARRLLAALRAGPR
ncbi:glycosyltransferase family 4 protein [Pseudaquabacterium pictum]|uniref:Glycosyl transferase family 1 domain-containing protein n=1 Tax=Pseudaquabacterium pictum TaxID=2315236 RepID=A0A480APY6_9BURK|nr:glycosyltransferase family 4 protein [Rubrivivax pictus]GCL63483.1 hypothetical protein AQPW35_25640 [Rubrivivax pictus]